MVDSGQLERNLGFLEAMTLGGGTMIGAGIFILPGIAAKGAGPASSISFAIAGGVALLAAISLSELATGMPISGGSYHYVNRGLGSFFGSIVGWGMWTGLMFASAFYMVGFGQYIVEPIPMFDGRGLIVLFGLLGLGLILGVNFYGTEESSSAQNIMIGTELLIVIAYTVSGVFFIEFVNLAEFAPTGPTGIMATTGTVFVTFLGFEIIATVAGEVKDPGRLIPLTMVLSVVSVTGLYVVVMIVSTGVVPYQQLGGSLVPVSDVAAISLGPIGVVAIVFAAVIAAISSSNSSILAASRVIFAMGRDGLMSDWLNQTHDRFNTPHRAIITTGAVTAALVSLGLEVEAIVALLAEVASFSFLVSYALVHVALVGFRYTNPPEYDPEFRVPSVLYPAVPVLGVVMTGVVISQMSTPVLAVGTGIVALGAFWYLVYARRRDTDEGLLPQALRTRRDTDGGLLPQPFGTSATPDRPSPYRVAVPIANPDTQRQLLRLAAAVAQTHADDDYPPGVVPERPELVAINVIEADPSTGQNVESDRLKQQRKLLETTREVAAGLDVTLETHSIVAPEAGPTIVDTVESVEPDQLLVGWRGDLERRDHVFGQTLDPILKTVPCDVSLVNVPADSIGTPVALAGPGPHAPAAAERAAEFAEVNDSTPVLLNVQSPGHSAGLSAEERGHRAIEWIADRAGLESDRYDAEVVVADDTEAAIVEAVQAHGTVCVGLSEKGDNSRILFGSIAERISQTRAGNVGIIRGALGATTEDPDVFDSTLASRDVGEAD
jgi:Amino acid transporters